MDTADFYTGIVVDAYAKLKSSTFDPTPYADFVATTGEPALEIGCGDGEPLLALRQAGLEVDGLDSSADMLRRCQANATALGLEVTLHHQRMQDLDLPHPYRAIYLAGPTFTLLPDDATALQALRGIRDHLTPDGRALIPFWIPAPTPEADLGVTLEAVDADGATLTYTPLSETYDEPTRTRTTKVRYERHAPDAPPESATRDWIIHWHTEASIQDLCTEAGFTIAHIATDEDDFTLAVRR
ncbi:methyltransferase domain-containing protein [Kribbella sp. NPDC051770]|uniref:class I SAM-dependent methyltransferase n=1 Tax=Kribbella sp. NPDC051770 TaxID=3155413 RepID=UPI00341631EA